MSEANVTITAHDRTAAAFRTADTRLKQFARTATQARSAFAALGLVLSVRAITGWIARSVEATEKLGIQTREVVRAREAFESYKRASDGLAVALGTRLTPIVQSLSGALVELQKSFAPTNLDLYSDRVTKVRKDLAELEDELQKRISGGISRSAPFAEQAIESLRKRIAALRGDLQVLEAAGPLPAMQQRFKFNKLPELRPPNVELDELKAPVTAPWAGMDFKRLTEESEKYRELRSESEELITAMMQDHLDRRRAAEEQYANDRIAREEMVADETRYWQEESFSSATSFLRLVGEEHRGAAIAAIALEKAIAIQRILLQGRMSAAAIVASGQEAAWKAMAQLGPLAGPPVAAKIAAASAASAAKVKALSIASAVFTGLEGAVQAARLSSGGTAGQLGSPANPLTTTNASSAAATTINQNRSQRVVEINIHGGVVTNDAVRNLVRQIRQQIDNADVILFGPNSRQART